MFFFTPCAVSGMPARRQLIGGHRRLASISLIGHPELQHRRLAMNGAEWPCVQRGEDDKMGGALGREPNFGKNGSLIQLPVNPVLQRGV